jgi:cytoskeleton protein RodZ
MTHHAEPVGRKLAQAREQRGLTIEEAALETKIRPHQIAALEADDYSIFPSNTYARGFLQIYGRFLDVDVRDITRQLEGSAPISIAEYQYLNIVQDTAPLPVSSTRRDREIDARRPSMAPLIVFVLMLGAIAIGFHLFLQSQRLELAQQRSPDEPPTQSSGAPAPTSPAPNIPPAVPVATGAVVPVPANAPLLTPPSPPPPLAQAPAPQLQPAPNVPQPAVPPAIHEIVLEPRTKMTWVRIRRDDPASEPIFDGELYPDVGPLKLRGSRFFIEIREPDALNILKDGQPLAYQPPGITIQ